ncbi:f-box domain-containing protein [Diplodia corticola]|uniref:F-box domain-containing protein n=1 Tax=Diplodia corticola TaxID=236234 RepID=A0A1J9QQH5_9PEZI|nr:f-box domain-containing protein [Diplodia corticola]OJD30705.1 f-box domain-containing protein [Diplodia corticola]
MDALPDELKLHVISYLDCAPPSDAHFFDEPDPHALTSFRDRSLKALSLVSPRWRRIIKPLLFHHLVFNLHILDDQHNEWIPSLAPELPRIRSFLAKFDRRHHVKSLVVCAHGEIYGSLRADIASVSTDFWSVVFDRIEPASIKIVAPPAALARLAGCGGCFQHSWAFEQSYHVLELRQNVDLAEHACAHPFGATDNLMARRRWCHIGYNEGSSLCAYNLYEYQHYRSPCVLKLLLERASWESSAATSLTYVAIFPTTENVTRWAKHLALLPAQCCLTFQLAPEPTSTILHEPHRMKRAQPADLWTELDRTYKILAGFLVLYNRRRNIRLSVKSRDYRWESLVETLDDRIHFGHLKRNGWAKAGDSEWVPLELEKHQSL